MKKIIFGLLIFAFSQAHAAQDVYGYRRATPKMVTEYLSLVDQNSRPQGPEKCSSMYQPILNKGVLDIRYALGYFDDSTGQDVVWGRHNYGPSPSLDIEIFRTLRNQLLGRCHGDLNLCAFREVAGGDRGKSVLEKYVNIQGRKVLVRFSLTQASATPSYVANKGESSAQQQFLTAQSEENYFGGLSVADVVFYNGHSRNGGGPDFNPPILNSHGKVDYDGYYEPRRIGISRMLNAIKANPNKGMIIGMFSCFSQHHFYNDFLNANPKQRMILSADTINYFDSLVASVGYLEGFLRGYCGQELANTAKQTEKIRGGFQGFQIN